MPASNEKDLSVGVSALIDAEIRYWPTVTNGLTGDLEGYYPSLDEIRKLRAAVVEFVRPKNIAPVGFGNFPEKERT